MTIALPVTEQIPLDYPMNNTVQSYTTAWQRNLAKFSKGDTDNFILILQFYEWWIVPNELGKVPEGVTIGQK
jgi:hypothetical protein